MISIFPPIYDDELLFSILGRYQYYEAGSSPREIMKNVFGVKSLRANIEFPTHLETLSRTLSHLDKSKEDFLMVHTIYSMYEPFITSEEAVVIKEMMYGNGGHRAKFKIGYIAGSVMKKESLSYCPSCIEENIKNNQEPYFRVIHQMQGVQVCHSHNVILESYPQSINEMSNIRYYHFDVRLIDSLTPNLNRSAELYNIAIAFKDIYEGCLEDVDLIKVKKAYKRKLNELGYLTVNGNVKNKKFIPEFISYYDEEFLKSLESEIIIEDEFNWIKNLLRSNNRKVHPLRHLLFILYFFKDIKTFKSYLEEKPTSNRYPCMNKICRQYKKLRLKDKDVSITADYKTREPIITAKCPMCGYTYSRKQSDDLYKVGRVKDFGDLWFKELEKISEDDTLSLRAKARHMGCDPGTIKKISKM